MQQIKISIPHFYCLEYIEDNKKLIVDIDFREAKIHIGKSLIKKWEKPYDGEEISEEKREEIYKTIMEYLLKSYSLEDLIEID